jgi:hypothetical protein
MSNLDVFVIVIGFACSLVIGVWIGLVISPKRLPVPIETSVAKADEIDDLKRQVGDWNAWYDTHMPACNALAQSNAAGRAVLVEWTEAQARHIDVPAEVLA